MHQKKSSYEKLVNKAKKLKALADRGIDSEKESAKRFYKEFIEKHGVDEGDVDAKYFSRVFKLKSREYEVLLSHIILSVNPFITINRKKREYVVVLDDADYIEVTERVNCFYEAFNKEKKLFFMAFMERFSSNFIPDEQSVNKHSQAFSKMTEAGESLNSKRSSPSEQKKESDPSDRISDTVLSTKAPQEKPLVGRNAKKYDVYKKCFDNIIYVKSSRKLNSGK